MAFNVALSLGDFRDGADSSCLYIGNPLAGRAIALRRASRVSGDKRLALVVGA